MDVAGPFNVSTDGSKYILTIIDIFSGYLVNVALKTTSAKEICEHLLNTYTIYGFPLLLSCDNATYFNSNFFQVLHEMLGVHKMEISTYSPWKVGKIEKSHSSLNKRLARCANEFPEEWHRQLKFITFSMNNTRSARTHLSPHEIIFGMPIKCPSTSFLNMKEAPLTVKEHMDFLLNSLHHNILQANIASQAYIAKMLTYTNQKARGHIDYAPLDAVWVFKTGNPKHLPRKLAPCFYGPFFISRKVQENVYKLTKHIGGNELRGSVAAQRLKPFYLKSCQPPEPSAQELSLIYRTQDPDLSFPAIELKDSCLDNDNVRTRDTDIDLYNVPNGNVDSKDLTDDLNSSTTDEQQNKSEGVDDKQPPIATKRDHGIDTTKIIEFASSKTRQSRKKNDYPFLEPGQFSKKNVLRIFGVMMNVRPVTYVIQSKQGEILKVTRSEISSPLLESIHGRHLNKLTQQQFLALTEKYEL